MKEEIEIYKREHPECLNFSSSDNFSASAQVTGLNTKSVPFFFQKEKSETPCIEKSTDIIDKEKNSPSLIDITSKPISRDERQPDSITPGSHSIPTNEEYNITNSPFDAKEDILSNRNSQESQTDFNNQIDDASSKKPRSQEIPKNELYEFK